MKKLIISFILIIGLGTIASAQIPRKSHGMTKADRAKWFRLLEWEKEDHLASDPMRFENAGFTFYHLGGRRWLVEIITGAGAYQRSYVFALLNESVSGKRRVKVLRFTDYYFDEKDKVRKETTKYLSGISSFDRRRNILTIFYKGAGLGYCGFLTTYGFVGDKARTIESRVRSCKSSATDFPGPEKWQKVKLF